MQNNRYSVNAREMKGRPGSGELFSDVITANNAYEADIKANEWAKALSKEKGIALQVEKVKRQIKKSTKGTYH